MSTISGIFQNLRRRAGAAGAPALKAGQQFHNEAENVVYAGFGDNGQGNATSAVKVGGSGAFMDLSTTQTVAGGKTFSGPITLNSPSGVTINTSLNQTLATTPDKAGLFGQWTINSITGQRNAAAGTGGQLILTVANDSADLSTGVGYGSSAAYIQYSYGGTNANGARYATIIASGQTSSVDATAYAAKGNPQEIGSIYATAAVADNCTVGGTPSNPIGAVIPLFSEVVMGQNAGNYLAATACELDTYLKSGASVKYKAGIHIACRDQARAFTYDCAIGISGFGTSQVGNTYGILFGPMSGGQPFGTDSTLIGTLTANGSANFPCTVKDGIDFTAYNITGRVLAWGRGVIYSNGAMTLVGGASAGAATSVGYQLNGYYTAGIDLTGCTATSVQIQGPGWSVDPVGVGTLKGLKIGAAANDSAGAWTGYTPTIGVTSGTAPTSTVNSASYQTIGKTIFVRFDISVTSASGSGALAVTLPFAPKSSACGSGREVGATGKMLQAIAQTNDAHAYVYFYDNSYPGASGNRLVVSLTYEAA